MAPGPVGEPSRHLAEKIAAAFFWREADCGTVAEIIGSASRSHFRSQYFEAQEQVTASVMKSPEPASAPKPVGHALKRSLFKGSAWSFLAAAGRQGFGFVIFIILSRLLSPTDFGLMAMAVAGVELLASGVTLGLIDTVVRKKDLSTADTSTFFWLTLATGCTLSLAIFLSAGSLSSVFDQPILEPLLQSLAVIPALQSLLTVPEGLLQSRMQFKQIAVRTLSATIGAGILSVLLALAGHGVYSLVFQRISTLAIIAFMTWRLSGFRPTFAFSATSARHVRKGLALVGSRFFTLGSGRAIDLISGLLLGPIAVGYYRVAGKLNDVIVQFLIDPLVKVSLTSFSRVQDDKPALIRMYRRLTQCCSLLTFPTFFGLALLAPQVTTLLFGEKWAVSGELMQILSLAGVGATLNFFYRPLMSSLNHAHELLRTQALQFGLITGATFFTAQHGIHAVMWGFVAVSFIITVWNLLQIRRHIGLTLQATATMFLPPLVSSIAMALLVWFGRRWLEQGPALMQIPLVQVGALIVLGAGFYVFAMLVVFRGYTIEVIKSLKPVFTKK